VVAGACGWALNALHQSVWPNSSMMTLKIQSSLFTV